MVKKKLKTRNEDDDDLLERRMEHAEEFDDMSYGICDWCDDENYLYYTDIFEAELCPFCYRKIIKDLQKAEKQLTKAMNSSP